MVKHVRVVLDCSELGYLMEDILSEVAILSIPPLFLYQHAIDALYINDWYSDVTLDGRLSIYSSTGELLINAIEYIATCIRARLERFIPVVTIERIRLLSVYSDTLYLQLTLPGENNSCASNSPIF